MRRIRDSVGIRGDGGNKIVRIQEPLGVSGHEGIRETFGIEVGVRKCDKWRVNEDDVWI